MKKASLFVLLFVPLCVRAESFLTAAQFPKTFDDLSFVDRMAVISEGIIETIYDENGKCISGCAYQGITLAEDIEKTTENTYAASLEASNTAQVSQTYQSTSPASYVSGRTDSTDQVSGPRCQVFNNILPNPNSSIPANPPIDKDIKISSDFGPRKAPKQGATSNHKGIDISVPSGTNIYATANGTVERIWDSGSGGLAVLIRHDGTNFHTAYFHLSDNKILRQGDKVQAGCLIAKSGNTGVSTGPHLHYAVYYTQPGKRMNYSSDPIDPIYQTNYLGVGYKFYCQKSSLHVGKTLPGEIK